jgi:hypothetical protein
VHANPAASAILEHFGVQGKLDEYDGKWYIECRVKTATDDVALSVCLKDEVGHGRDTLDLDGITAPPGRSGVGRQVMEALEAYCRPRGVELTLYALKDSAPFFRQFNWLEEVPPGSRHFRSVW